MPGVKITSLPVVPLQNSDIIPAGRTGGVTVGIQGGEFLNKFSDLYTRINTLSANTIYVNDTPTIRLTYNNNTRLLTANLRETLDLTAWNGKLKLPTDIEIPPGAIMPFALNAAPDGWLVCDGSNSLPNGTGTFQGKTANFGRLYNALGNTYGALGTLPDLRGYFIRGFGTNVDGTASYNVFGAKQADAFQGHKHDLYDPEHGHTGSADEGGEHEHKINKGISNLESVSDCNVKEGDTDACDCGQWWTEKGGKHGHPVTVSPNPTNVKVLSPTGDTATAGSGDSNGPGGSTPRVSNETRPKNVSLLYCIKY